ncbi:AtpZ/AtpI family protein [Kineococcus glutinatus]|uniref:F0F1-ATPase subunit (Ca2+/Mg2+ transporter) n=1 Tax=Kineococcus glutinatus TaxID=1070872 RepID=A0ABP8VE63_9ACTN
MTDEERPARPPEDGGGEPPPESAAWRVTSNLLAGVLLGGAVGWGVDRLLGTDFVVAIGLLAGIALTLYYVWLRYGTH